MQSSSEDNIKSLEDSKSDFDLLEEFMGFKGKALKDLDEAKLDLEKRAAQIQELATKTSEQFGGAIKINSDLKGKITFLQDLISSLSKKNEELERTNKELHEQKEENTALNNDLKIPESNSKLSWNQLFDIQKLFR